MTEAPNTSTGSDELAALLASIQMPDDNDAQPTEPTEPSPPDPASPATEDSGTAAGSAPEGDAGAAGTEGDEPPAETDPAAPPVSKANQAFAQMRVQNSTYKNVLETLLTRMGVDPSLAATPDKMQTLLEQAATQEEAKKTGLPPEVLQRIQQLETRAQQAEAKRLYESAAQGFREVKDLYKLSTKEIEDFATQLEQAGVNPFAVDVDLMQQYRVMNFDALMAKERERAVQEALKKQTTAQTRSTVPTSTVGKPTTPSDEGEKVNNMAQFNSILRTL